MQQNGIQHIKSERMISDILVCSLAEFWVSVAFCFETEFVFEIFRVDEAVATRMRP